MKSRLFQPSTKRIYRGKFFYFLIATYIFMLVLPLCFSLFALRTTGANINTSLDTYNETLLDRYSNSLYTQMEQVSLLAYELNDHVLIRQLAAGQEITAKTRLEIYKLIEKMPARLMVSYPQVTDYYIVFPNCDLVVTSTGTYPMELFYNVMFSGAEDVGYEQWQSHFSTPTVFSNYHAAPCTVLSQNMSKKNIAYTKSIAFGNTAQDYATIVILISKEYLRSHCLTSELMTDGEVSLFNHAGQLVLTTNASGASTLHYDSEKERYLSENQSDMISTYPLDKLDACLVYTLHEGDFTARLWSSYLHLRTVILILAIVSLLMAVLFAFIFYHPLGELVSYLRDKQNTSAPELAATDSYHYIRTSFDRIMASHEARGLELEMSKRLIAENQLERLRETEDAEDTADVPRTLTQYEIDLPYAYIIVLGFEGRSHVFHYDTVWHSFCSAVQSGMGSACQLICLHKK